MSTRDYKAESREKRKKANAGQHLKRAFRCLESAIAAYESAWLYLDGQDAKIAEQEIKEIAAKISTIDFSFSTYIKTFEFHGTHGHLDDQDEL